jgi:hypothetical protein
MAREDSLKLTASLHTRSAQSLWTGQAAAVGFKSFVGVSELNTFNLTFSSPRWGRLIYSLIDLFSSNELIIKFLTLCSQ